MALAPGAYTVSVTITYNGGTTLTCEIPVVVKPLPVCGIAGPNGPLCPSSPGNVYAGPAGMDAYTWSITGNGTIVGPTTGLTVSVTAGANCVASFILTLTVTKGGSSSTLSKTVLVRTYFGRTASLG